MASRLLCQRTTSVVSPIKPWGALGQYRGMMMKQGQPHYSGPMAAYMDLVDTKKIRKSAVLTIGMDITVQRDPKQVTTLEKLQALYETVVDFDRDPSKYSTVSYQFVNFHVEKKVTINAPKGLYLYGGVGTGKTFVMDLFYDNLPVERRRRVHFNAFMLDVHERLHKLRAKGRHAGDPLETIVDDLMKQAWLLCFDEFQVTDVADAMILKRLFSGMLNRGAVMISTSNREPSELYKNGLQRDLFLPFIDLLKQKHEVHDMNSTTDFRLVRRSFGAANTYFVAPPTAPRAEQDEAKYNYYKIRRELTKGQDMVTIDLSLQGRRLRLPQVALSTRTACMSFQELCGMPLGAADYIKLGNTISTLFLTDVPFMTIADVNLLRRFITLVDCLYEAKTDIVILAQAHPKELFCTDAYKESAHDEVFAFDRTVSRLTEMQGDDYWRRTRRPIGTDVVEVAMAEIPPGTPGGLREGSKGRSKLEAVWKYYDLDESNTWNLTKFHAFLQDLSELRVRRRDVPWKKEAEVFKSLADEKGLIQFGSLCQFWENDQHHLIDSDLRPADSSSTSSSNSSEVRSAVA